MSKEWKIPVEWCEFGVLRVEADSLEEAIRKVHFEPDEFPLPDDESYIDGTFKVCLQDELNPTSEENVEFIREYYNM